MRKEVFMKAELRKMKPYRWQYFMISLGVICLILFNYIPILGLQIAFKNFKIGSSIWSGEWVGFKNFWFLRDSQFWKVMKNTVRLTMTKFAFSFPAPIILALLINEIQNLQFKKIVQSITYIPHFISWVVIVYMLDSFLSPYSGLLNEAITAFGGRAIYFMGDKRWFVPLFVIASIWKEVGWGTIVYLAALSGINQELYEAATIDGAGKLAQTRYITLPCLRPTISMLFILALPGILSAGVDAVYPLMNSANMDVAAVLDIYILQNGLERGQYSFSTAVGMISSIFSLILVLISNTVLKKVTGEGIW